MKYSSLASRPHLKKCKMRRFKKGTPHPTHTHKKIHVRIGRTLPFHSKTRQGHVVVNCQLQQRVDNLCEGLARENNQIKFNQVI